MNLQVGLLKCGPFPLVIQVVNIQCGSALLDEQGLLGWIHILRRAHHALSSLLSCKAQEKLDFVTTAGLHSYAENKTCIPSHEYGLVSVSTVTTTPISSYYPQP